MNLRHLQALLVSERHFGRIVLTLIGFGFIALLAASLALVIQNRRSDDMGQRVEHSRIVDQALGEFLVQLERAETGRRGLLVDQDASYVGVYWTAAGRLPDLLSQIRALTSDNPVQVRHAAVLERLVNEQLSLLDRSVDLARSGSLDLALTEFRSDVSTRLTRNIRVVAEAMQTEERRLLARRVAAQARSDWWLGLIIGVADLLILLMGLASGFVIFRYTRALSASQRALQTLNQNLEQAVEERTADLQRANDDIQRFAYIVSHDLRSPLVNVMGFTSELDSARKPMLALLERAEAEAPQIVDEQARLAVREDIPEAIGFIRTSTQKMDRLIGAILKLSREGRRTLTPEPIDITQMVRAIAATLQHRTAEIGAEIQIEGALPPIVSDRLALEQIFSNLIENAVKYLKPGRPGRVVVRGYRLGERLGYEIEDNGRGIDAKDHQRVFDLFRRSGAQDQPGEGIGLAHVRATVYRLGGIIELESALDQGTTFRLVLPPIPNPATQEKS